MSTSKVATMQRRRCDPRARRRHRGHRGLHAPHLLRGGPRDHPPAEARPDPGSHDAGPHLRPDDRRRRGVASSSSRWLGNPGVGGLHAIRRRIEDGDPAPLELEEYSHFGMVARYTAGAMNLPFFPLRSYFETDLPKANPLIRPHRLAVRRRARSTPCRRSARTWPSSTPSAPMPPATRRSGACSGCQKEAAFAADRRHRRGRGAGRRVGHPRGPQPHGHPGPHRRRGRRRALRRASLVRPGLLRPRQPLLRGVGRHQAGRRRSRRLARRVRLRRGRPRRVHGAARRRGSGAASGHPARRRPGRSTTASTDERGPRTGLQPLRDDDRGGGARAGGPAGLLRRASGCPTSRSTWPSAPWPRSWSWSTKPGSSGPSPRGCRCRIGDPTIVTGATAVISMLELFGYYLQRGLVDVGFLGAAQIDRFGNINTTVIGDYAQPTTRLPGSGGACEIAINAREVFVIMRQSPRAASWTDRLPDLARQPGRRGGRRRGSERSRAGWDAARRSS